MILKIYQIDTFTSHVFSGNPAAVCPLPYWLPTSTMQSIAAENNLSETVFFVTTHDIFDIRWFTPTVEVALCGHATLAAAYVLFEELNYDKTVISFYSKSGLLRVSREEGRFALDFPAQDIVPCVMPTPLALIFPHAVVKACFSGSDYLVVLKHEDDVFHACPDMQQLQLLGLRGVIITAKSQDYDFVSRFFAPNIGVDEDPVTGSSFTQLIPYWAKELAKSELIAKQVSTRGGEVFCELLTERVKIAGQAVKYLEGTIAINVDSNA